MSYLAELVSRVMDPGGGLRPRLPSLFEPVEGSVAETEPPAEAAVATGARRSVVAAVRPEAEDPASDGPPEEVERFRPARTAASPPSRPGPAGRRDDHVLPGAGEAPAELAAVRVPGAVTARGPSEASPAAAGRAAPEPSRRAAAVSARRTVVRRAAGPPTPEPEPRAEPASAAARRLVERGRIAAAPADVRAIAAAAPRAGRGPARARAADPAGDPPAVRVTIGRIDVRAGEPPLVAPEPAPPAGPEPLRLEDYLRQRDAGER